MRSPFKSPDSTPIMIISIRLQDITDMGSGAVLAYHYMYNWLPNDIAYYDLPFTLDAAGCEKYYKEMMKLVKALLTGEFKKYAFLHSFHIYY